MVDWQFSEIDPVGIVPRFFRYTARVGQYDAGAYKFIIDHFSANLTPDLSKKDSRGIDQTVADINS